MKYLWEQLRVFPKLAFTTGENGLQRLTSCTKRRQKEKKQNFMILVQSSLYGNFMGSIHACAKKNKGEWRVRTEMGGREQRDGRQWKRAGELGERGMLNISVGERQFLNYIFGTRFLSSRQKLFASVKLEFNQGDFKEVLWFYLRATGELQF